MTESAAPSSRPRVAVDRLYYLTGVFFFVYLFAYYWTSAGGPSLLALTLVPVTFILFTLDELRKNEFYPRLAPAANTIIATVYIVISIAVAVYMHVEYFEIGTVRAGIYSTADLVMGALMVSESLVVSTRTTRSLAEPVVRPTVPLIVAVVPPETSTLGVVTSALAARLAGPIKARPKIVTAEG